MAVHGVSRAQRSKISRGGAHKARVDEFENSLVRRALVWLAAVEIVGLALAFDVSQRALHPIDLPKSLIAVGAAAVMLALLAVLILTFGPEVLPRSPVLWSLAVYVVAVVLATLFAEDRFVALFGYQSRYLGASSLLAFAALCLGVGVACRYPLDRYILGCTVMVAAAVAVAYGALQLAGLDPMRWTFLDPKIRPFATFGNPDVFGHFLSAAFGLAAGVAVWPAHGGGRIRIAALALALVTLVIGGPVATRGMILGILSALAVILVLYVLGRRPPSRRGVAIIVPVLLLGGALLASSPLGARVRDTIRGGGLPADRQLVFRGGLEMFAARPLFGWGPDNIAVAWPRYEPPESVLVLGPGHLVDSAHDWAIDVGATTGAVGVAALGALFTWSAIALFRSSRTTPGVAAPALVALAAFSAHSLVAVSALSVDWLPWVAFGLAAATDRVPVLAVRRRPGRMAVLVPALVGLSVVAGGLRQLGVDQDANAVGALISQGRPDVAVVAAQTLVDRDPRRADNWDLYGKAFFAQQRWKSAGDAFQAAADLAPYERAYWQNVALSRLREGNGQGAFAAARRGTSANPNEPAPHLTMAEVAASLRMDELALDEAMTALRLRGDPVPATQLIASAAERVEISRGRAAVEDALGLSDVVPLRLALGRIALRANDLEAARTNAQRVLDRDPTNQEAKAILDAANR